jgi:hypothetical protein
MPALIAILDKPIKYKFIGLVIRRRIRSKSEHLNLNQLDLITRSIINQ